MRLDLLLVRLRFCRSRAIARRWIAEGHMRRNGLRVMRPDQRIGPGDVLTLPHAGHVGLIEILALPIRRGPADEARACYRPLDRGGQPALAAAPDPGRDELPVPAPLQGKLPT